ncbi:hypothetical protein [Sphingobium sp. BS19]|uniref:hypothetical protein n=1 Tax=Sphingobium sp. BS19 TaxID=3018973 RepID=UPI0022EDDF0C|nr:hypothetical protein [Sphingobium sp. BS19]GLI99101.1 hypothetical protein Sbs19_29190 [Sphingobium sp. BS19]
MMRELIASIALGWAAYWLAIGVGITAWRDWTPGDASDIGACVALGVWLLSAKTKGTTP